MDQFHGYTLDQIRQMDIWFRQQNLSWQVLDQKWREGFEAGVTADRQIIEEHLQTLHKKLKQSAQTEKGGSGK